LVFEYCKQISQRIKGKEKFRKKYDNKRSDERTTWEIRQIRRKT
jgi:hypothetical protein